MITKAYIDNAIALSEAGQPAGLPEVRGFSSGKVRCLLNHLCQLPNTHYLEIGTHVGNSLRIWRECLDPELLIGVQDTDELPERTQFELDVVAIRGRSQEERTYDRVRQALGGQEIDFLYVDGDHTLNPLRQDWALYSPLVRSGGIAVLHDAVIRGNDTVDVYKFWPEVAAKHRTKLLHDPTVPSTGAGVVFL